MNVDAQLSSGLKKLEKTIAEKTRPQPSLIPELEPVPAAAVKKNLATLQERKLESIKILSRWKINAHVLHRIKEEHECDLIIAFISDICSW